MNEPLVSVIVPVYNAEKTLHKCVDSILSQTLTEIEIILVNDGSVDNSGVICDSYCTRDERVRVIHLDNGGPARARNKGIELAQGEYVGFVDSDDYIDEEMYEVLYHTVAGRDMAMCGYNIVKDGKSNAVVLNYPKIIDGEKYIKDSLIQRYYTGNVNGLYSLWNKLFKTKLIKKKNVSINEQLIRAEDAWFVYDFLKIASSFAFTSKSMYYYTQNPNSIMHTMLPNQYELWKYNKERLLAESKNYSFEIDMDQFYYTLLYKICIHFKELAAEKKI